MKVPQEYLDKLNASNGFTPEGNPVNTQRVEGHTQLPWRLAPASEYLDSDLNIDAHQKGFIATAGKYGDSEAEANAAFIVHACNNIERLEKVNEALVRALERLVEMRETHERISGMEKQHYIISDNEDWSAGRAALALAKEPA